MNKPLVSKLGAASNQDEHMPLGDPPRPSTPKPALSSSIATTSTSSPKGPLLRRRTLVIGGGLTLLGGAGLWSVARMGSSSEYARATTAMRAPLADGTARELIRYGTLAASSHNTQPWHFREASDGIDVLADTTRRTPVVDPDDHHLFVSLGCAIENILLAGAAMGRHGSVVFSPEEPGRIRIALERGPRTPSALVDAIPLRQTTRTEYDGRALTDMESELLRAAAVQDGVDVVLLTERSMLERVRDLVVAGNTAQMADPEFVAELLEWIRFNPAEALSRNDGLYSAASGSPTLPTWLGRSLFDLVFRVDDENDKYARQVRGAAGVAVFFAQREDPEHWVEVGRASQRFALRATALGLKYSFLNQPVEVMALRAELASLVGMPGRRPDLLIRFGRGPSLPMSARRPVRELLA